MKFKIRRSMEKEYMRLVTLVSVLIAVGYSGLDGEDAWGFGQVFGGIAMGTAAWLGLKASESPITKGLLHCFVLPALVVLGVIASRNHGGFLALLTWLGLVIFFLAIRRIAKIQMMKSSVGAS
ncbi:hypothetical protein [Roseibacillus persicicus]|uniref:hypothetical protein n=1 Tax=Roseibacillus persicicus TaxID=454148 RepID=UPI00280F0760|nr:hypothetical protein [Roseibacillus persicicus]MDQ8190424.1 hypothetical protein [Roseibacillus persicicus]